MHLNSLVISFLSCRIQRKSGMKHDGVVSQVWYEIAKVVNETKERTKLVRIDQEGELLNMCDFGGVRQNLSRTDDMA